MGILNLITMPALTFTLFLVWGQVCKRRARHEVLFTLVGVCFLFVVSALHEVYQLPFLVIGSLALILGRFVQIGDTAFRKCYAVSVFAALGLTLSDLLYNSGVGQFGLPSSSQLSDPRLAAYAITESFISSGVAMIVAVVLYLIAQRLGRRVGPVEHNRTTFWPFFIAALFCFAVEPQLHLKAHHPYWVHHPFVTVTTVAAVCMGASAGRRGILPTAWPLRGDSLSLAVAAFFFTYHFVAEMSEHTSFPFSIRYGWFMMLAFTVSLPFGVLVGHLSSMSSLQPTEHPPAKTALDLRRAASAFLLVFSLCWAGCGPTPRSVARTIDAKRVRDVSVRVANLQSIVERTIAGDCLFAGDMLGIACTDPDLAVRLAAIDGFGRLIEKLPRDFGIEHPLAIHASSGPALNWSIVSRLMGLREDESTEVRLSLANMLAEHDVRITSLSGFDHFSSLKTLQTMAEDENAANVKSSVLRALRLRLIRESKNGWISHEKAKNIAKRHGIDLPE